MLPGASQTQLTAVAAPVHVKVGGCQIFSSNNFWNRDISMLPIAALKRIPASAFVAVNTAPLKVDNDSAATR